MESQATCIYEVHAFIVKYATHLMGCGVHSSRVIRNTTRISQALGYEAELCIMPQHIIVTVQCDKINEKVTEVARIPHLPINFKHNSELSALSWSAFDEQLSLEDVEARYSKIVNTPRLSFFLVLTFASAANASFCKLFGGDATSIVIVFIATAIAFYFRTLMLKTKVNIYFIVFLTAFLASLTSSLSLLLPTTSDIALATSVLFLVPGVPLINGIIDTFDGHILTGISRLIQATLIIVSLASGLGATLMLIKGGLI